MLLLLIFLLLGILNNQSKSMKTLLFIYLQLLLLLLIIIGRVVKVEYLHLVVEVEPSTITELCLSDGIDGYLGSFYLNTTFAELMLKNTTTRGNSIKVVPSNGLQNFSTMHLSLQLNILAQEYCNILVVNMERI